MRKKRLVTRKTKTLRRAALCLALLIIGVLLSTAGTYQFTRAAAVREMEENYGVAPMWTVKELDDPVLFASGDEYDFTIAANENAMAHYALHFSPLHGWSRLTGACLEFSGAGAPVQAEYHTIRASRESAGMSGWERYTAIFGRVEDDNIESMEVFLDYEHDEYDTTVSSDGFIEHGGERYFYLVCTEVLAKTAFPISYIIRCSDAQGETVYEGRIMSGTSSSLLR